MSSGPARQASPRLPGLRPAAATASERSRERYVRAGLTAVAAAGARGVALLTTLVAAPIVIPYLGTEQYGLWVTITSVVTLVGFSDLGLANGALTAVSEANGRGDREGAAAAVSTAFYLLLGVAVLLGAAFAAVYSLVPWDDVFNVSSSAAIAQAGPSMLAFVCCLLARMPLTLVEKVEYGYQRGYVAGTWTAAGNVAGLTGVIVAVSLEASLPWLVVATAGAPTLAALVNGVTWIGIRRPWLRPALSRVRRATAWRLVRLGGLFFALDLAVAIAFASDPIVAAQVLGAPAAAQYWLPMRVFSVAPFALAVVFTALWPAYGEAIARGDIDWVRRTLTGSLKLAVGVTVPIALLLVAIGPSIVSLLSGGKIEVGASLLAALGVWSVLFALSVAVGMFLNGAQVVGLQVVVALTMAAVNLALSIVLANEIGVSGVVWATVIALAVCVAAPYAIAVPRIVARLGQRDPSIPEHAQVDDGCAPAMRPSSRVAEAIMALHVACASWPRPLGLLRRLSGRARGWWSRRAGDPPVRHRIGGRTLLLPLSHQLPVYERALPEYGTNMGRVAALIAEAHPQRGAIDVGANVGDSAARIHAAGMPVLCIEPHERFARLLDANVSGWEEVEVDRALLGAAVGEARGKVHVAGGTAYYAIGEQRPDWVPEGHAEEGTLRVETLDLVLERHPRFRSAALLKIDTEGRDLQVLRGAARLLEEAPVVFCEYDPDLLRARGEERLALPVFLRERGYETIAVWENDGRYLQSVGLKDTVTLKALEARYAGEHARRYSDVAAFHERDRDLADRLAALEDERTFLAPRR